MAAARTHAGAELCSREREREDEDEGEGRVNRVVGVREHFGEAFVEAEGDGDVACDDVGNGGTQRVGLGRSGKGAGNMGGGGCSVGNGFGRGSLDDGGGSLVGEGGGTTSLSFAISLWALFNSS